MILLNATLISYCQSMAGDFVFKGDDSGFLLCKLMTQV
jgi:hypothetical protein